MFRQLGSATLFTLGLFFTACAPGSDLGEVEDTEDRASALSVPFVELSVKKSPASNGLTVLTKTSDYVAFFGEAPPSSVDFKKHWVLHYSSGVQSSGGYDANIASIERMGSGPNAHLVVGLEDVSPGPMCMVTMALTNPQTTVRIPKQNKSITVDQKTTETITDCSEPDWCAAALCAPGATCDELQDACVEEAFCPRVRCANGTSCDEELDACVGWLCDPADASSCPTGMVCDNQIVCITYPCPAEYRCEMAPPDPCQGIGWVGVCEGTTLKYCDADVLEVVECAPGDCGFSGSNGYYDCM